MGTDELAVVDPRLQVRGLEALRVVDSSVMPRIVSGSTQAPSMMIGEMGATMMLAARR
jgi:choline dehydrogenase